MDTIAVDICNTICDYNGILDMLVGRNPNPETYNRPGLNDEFFSKNLWVFEKALPIPHSCYVLNKLSKVNKIVYITSRPIEAEEVTLNWLRKHGYPKGEIYFTKDKASLAKQLGVTLAFEDDPEHINAYKKAGINVFVKAQPYNKSFECRIDWYEFAIPSYLCLSLTPVMGY